MHKDHHIRGPRGVPPISIYVEDMDDRTLLTLASIEDHSAREEILKRHIMDVDHVNYNEACEKFAIIAHMNIQGYYMVALPYKVGIFTASALAMASVPLVFDLPTVQWFNEWAVTTDVPESRDLDTPLEVSIWSWNWMEVCTVTIAICRLCIQLINIFFVLNIAACSWNNEFSIALPSIHSVSTYHTTCFSVQWSILFVEYH